MGEGHHRVTKPARGSSAPPRRVDDFGVDLYGPFDLVTGLGESSRGYARALQQAQVPVHLTSLSAMYPGLASLDPGLTSDSRRFPLVVAHVNADTTDAFLWRYGGQLTGARARVGVWFWELAALRSDWILNTLRYDEIWVASRFGQRAVAAVTNVPVEVVPPPVLAPVAGDGASARRRLGIPDEDFVFLYVFDYSSYVDRKNPLCLVDAFLDEFKDQDGVWLVLKVTNVHPDDVGFRRLQQAAASHGRLLLVTDVLSPGDLGALFAMSECYVSPHRSEGFGLTVAEAMLSGCTVIATDYGATTDFITPETGFPLEYSLVEIDEDRGPYRRGYVWADPSREHLRSLMREVIADVPAARMRAAAGRQFIETRYGLDAAGERMLHRLQRLYGAGSDE
jgi:glycosyltransferase involved in cell wall biosynthesis